MTGMPYARDAMGGVRTILDTIGNTPLVKLTRVVPSYCAEVVVKLEYFSPTGSYKDRMALAMIEGAEAREELKPGMTVVEYTGGNSGASLAFVCAVKGYKLEVVSSDAFGEGKLRAIRAFGANVSLVQSEGGQITEDLVPRMVEQARTLAQGENTYLANELENADSVNGYENIGRELLAQAEGPIHAFCAGVGTAAMIMGAARALRAGMSAARIVVLEPAGSALLTTGEAGAHGVEGTGIGFVPPLLNRYYYDDARSIDEGEARQMARRLAREEGIFAGASTGLNVVGAIQLARELGPNYTVATVAVDTGLKYLDGDLYRDP
jgi:cysteine synthase A